jgi:hypothetical protein
MAHDRTKGMVMTNKEGSSALVAMKLLGGAAALAATLLIVTAAASLSPRQAQATPAYAAQTKLPCGQCHVNAGGGPTNAFGKAFADNGHKVPAKN